MNETHPDFNPQAAVPPAPPVLRRLAVRFTGSGSEYFRIWIVNLLLTVLTLGLYYPYAKLRRLRYFFGNTEVGGYPLSFHADPRRMFLGYLLVAALLGAYSLAGRLSPTAGVVAFVVLAVVWPLLWHSALRFRMANTSWRGLRLGFVGTQGQAYRALLPGFVLGLVVLVVGALAQTGATPTPKGKLPEIGMATWAAGLLPLLMLLALPWLLWLMRRYQHQHYTLAAERTQFSTPLKSFFGLGLRTLGLSILAVLPMAAVIFGFSVVAAAVGGGKPGANNQAMVFFYGLAAGLIALAVFQMLVRPYITSRTQNLVWNGTQSQHLRFESQLRLRSMMVLTLKNWLLMIVTLGLYLPFAMVATASLRLSAVTVISSIDPDSLLAQPGAAHTAAAGEAAGDLFGIDIGL